MRQILVVDDEPGIVQLLEMLLKDGGYGVSGAASGSQALEIIRSEQIDLILLDLMMPGMTGWEFLDELKKIKRKTRPPVAIVSAVIQDAAMLRAEQEYGTCAYITKPFKIDELLDVINGAIH